MNFSMRFSSFAFKSLHIRCAVFALCSEIFVAHHVERCSHGHMYISPSQFLSLSFSLPLTTMHQMWNIQFNSKLTIGTFISSNITIVNLLNCYICNWNESICIANRAEYSTSILVLLDVDLVVVWIFRITNALWMGDEERDEYRERATALTN